MTFLSLSFFLFFLCLVSFFFLLPAIPHRGLSSCNVACASCCRKIQILSRIRKNIPRSHRSRVGRPFVASPLSLTPFSPPPSLYPLYLSAFPRYWDPHSAGFRQARLPLSALTVPLGSSPLTNPEEWRDSWRAFPSAPRRDQCVMQVVTKKKIGWKRNPYPRRKTEVRRTVGKSRLTIRGNSLRLSVLRRLSLRRPSASRIFNGKIMRGIYSREFPSLLAGASCHGADTARERRRRRLETNVLI